MNQNELYQLVKQYHKLLEYKRLIDSHLHELRQQLLEILPPNKPLQIGEFTVKVSKYTQSRLDTHKLKEFLGNDYKDFLVQFEVNRIEVKKNDRS